MNVTATGTWRPRANGAQLGATRAGGARRCRPGRAGARRPAIRSAACSIASSVGSGKYGRADGSSGASAAVDLGRRDVLGQLDVGRARASPAAPPGTPWRRSRGSRPARSTRAVPLRDRLEHPRDVDVLVGLLVDLVDAGLPGDRDHRRAVEVGVGDARHEVRRARPERRHRDRAAAGQPAVDVGHERGALLVAGRDVADARMAGRARRGCPSSPRRARRRRTRSPRPRGSRRGGGRRSACARGHPAVYGLSGARTVRRRPAARPATRARTWRAPGGRAGASIPAARPRPSPAATRWRAGPSRRRSGTSRPGRC